MVTTTDEQKQAGLGHIPVELGFGYKYASRAVLWLSSCIGWKFYIVNCYVDFAKRKKKKEKEWIKNDSGKKKIQKCIIHDILTVHFCQPKLRAKQKVSISGQKHQIWSNLNFASTSTTNRIKPNQFASYFFFLCNADKNKNNNNLGFNSTTHF